MAPDIEFSVLLPLQDARHTGDECLRAWTTEQTFPRERYEVVVIAPGFEPALEARWRGRIGGNDRWIVYTSDNEYDMFNAGAAHARGRFLFLTEAHCVPLPDCLEAMHAHLERTGDVGARGRTIGESVGKLGAFEHRVFEPALQTGEDTTHWNKVLIHSLALRPDVYAEGGGLDNTYGDFCPWVLSVALWERGHRLGFAEDVQVRHIFDGDLDEIHEHVRRCGGGEMVFRMRAAAVADKYLDETCDWTQRWTYTRDVARERLRAAVAVLRPGAGPLRVLAAEAAVAAFGPRMHVLAKGIEVKLARLAVQAGRDERRRFEVYRHYWHTVQRLGAIEAIVANGVEMPPEPSERSTYDLTSVDAPSMSGVNVVETWEGRAFRWSGPLALVRVCLPRGVRFEGRLEFLPIRGPSLPNLRLALGGRRIDHREYRHEPNVVRFPVTGGGTEWLAIACDAFRPCRQGVADWRALGAPLVSLTFDPR